MTKVTHRMPRINAATLLAGQFSQSALPRYLAAKAAIFWSLIALAWWAYPEENSYSIWTHTFSFLGSFESRHSPEWWWLFSIAMTFWGVATVPIALFWGRRFSPVSRWGARMGTGFLLLGCLGVVLVALFPDARDPVFGEMRFTEVHEKAAVLVALGFTLAILWFAGLLFRDALATQALRGARGYRRFLPPFLFWAGVTGLGIYFQVRWAYRYEALRAAADAEGTSIGSAWSESLGTIDGFPFWENLVIYALYIFIIWFSLALGAPTRREAIPKGSSSS
jgi:hypothetical membrane protein